MSILYNAKVTSSELMVPSLQDLQECWFHAMNDNHRHQGKALKLDLKGAPKKLTIEDLVNRAGGASPEQVAAQFLMWNEADVHALGATYGAEGSPRNQPSRHYVAHRVLSALDERIKQLPVLRLSIEVVSVHPDAGFPKYRSNALVKDNHERSFLSRLLADLERGLGGGSAICDYTEQWDREREAQQNQKVDPEIEEAISKALEAQDFDEMARLQEKIPDLSPKIRAPGDAVVWGFSRDKGMKLRPESKAFWKKHADSWWAPGLSSYLTSKSDNQPYELIPYTVMMHPGWFENPGGLSKSQSFESTAYWSD